ncbi:MAG: SDR family oxidoreductase [Anaerolineaceae bacterium]|nr:SDR family oxidoreductase [Anaerolineaceae bacterium]
MSVDFSVKGKVIVITGATGVICSALAKELAALGAKLVLVSRHLESGKALASEIKSVGGEALALCADVLNKASLNAAKEEALSRFGSFDVLINGAGGNKPEATTGPGHTFFQIDEEAFKNVLDLNLTGAFLSSQVFGEVLAQKGHGVILNIASMASFQPLTNVLAYASAKAALVNFTQWLAVHLNQNYSPDLRVNALAPGFFLTNQNRYLLQNADGLATERGMKILAKTPMGRYGSPEDLLGAVIWLCSESSRFVNGVVIPVDGGFSAYSGV